jgi:hypothetical protein
MMTRDLLSKSVVVLLHYYDPAEEFLSVPFCGAWIIG